MEAEFSIPTTMGQRTFAASSPSSLIFVGANGGGKTRLAVYLEQQLAAKAHRISAHRALSLNPKVSKISEEQSLSGLWIGNVDSRFSERYELRNDFRWSKLAATKLLDDFDFLLQALFAEQSNRALVTHKQVRAGTLEKAEETKFERLTRIWEQLLPHRRLHISGDDILVSAGEGPKYSASELSDGERAVFYLIGQALVAKPDSVLIIDEPELHLHRSIMAKLWDTLESARPDCVFVYITHDLEFAALRQAQKIVIRSFNAQPAWELEDVPISSGFSEELTTLILGSRAPILFVEGRRESLDVQTYRALYPGWTVIPRGSCTEVVHAVRTLKQNAALTRIDCAGIVDADGFLPDEAMALASFGICVLPVAEIENVFLCPDVAREVARLEDYPAEEVERKVAELSERLFAFADDDAKISRVVVRYCKRRIDRALKVLNLGDATDLESLIAEYGTQTEAIDIAVLAAEFEAGIRRAISNRDLPALLRQFDNKGMLGVAATVLKNSSASNFQAWLARTLASQRGKSLADSIREKLPALPVQSDDDSVPAGGGGQVAPANEDGSVNAALASGIEAG